MEKTIKQLADELNISKDKVKYQVRKLPSKLTSKKDGITHLSEQAIAIIKSNLTGNVTQEIPSELPKGKGFLPSDFLLNELDKKDVELEEKNIQIKKLHTLFEQQQKLLDQQQVLTLQANKKIEQLELSLEQTDEEDKMDEPVSKTSFWSKLFQ